MLHASRSCSNWFNMVSFICFPVSPYNPPPPQNMAYKPFNTRNGLYISHDVLLHLYFSKQLLSIWHYVYLLGAELRYTCRYSTAQRQLNKRTRVPRTCHTHICTRARTTGDHACTRTPNLHAPLRPVLSCAVDVYTCMKHVRAVSISLSTKLAL